MRDVKVGAISRLGRVRDVKVDAISRLGSVHCMWVRSRAAGGVRKKAYNGHDK